MYRFRVRYNDQANVIMFHPSGDVAHLQREIGRVYGIDFFDVKMKTGFPPTELHWTDEQTIGDVLTNEETIVIEIRQKKVDPLPIGVPVQINKPVQLDSTPSEPHSSVEKQETPPAKVKKPFRVPVKRFLNDDGSEHSWNQQMNRKFHEFSRFLAKFRVFHRTQREHDYELLRIERPNQKQRFGAAQSVIRVICDFLRPLPLVDVRLKLVKTDQRYIFNIFVDEPVPSIMERIAALLKQHNADFDELNPQHIRIMNKMVYLSHEKRISDYSIKSGENCIVSVREPSESFNEEFYTERSLEGLIRHEQLEYILRLDFDPYI